MQLARIRVSGTVVPAARIDDGDLIPIDGIAGVAGDDLVEILGTVGAEHLRALVAEHVESGAAAARAVPVADAEFEVPVKNPQKLIGTSLNYAAHAAEGNQAVPTAPVVFFLPPSSLLPHNGTVVIPRSTTRIDYEVELAIVLGRRARNVRAEDWRSVVAGFTIVNDVTDREVQLVAIERNEPWDLSKAYDTFSPCGPYLVPASEVANPNDLSLSLRIGDRLLQDSRTDKMLFGVGALIELLSSTMTLEPGDIIATGTPSGIGPVVDGEVMEASIEGLGTLVNTARREEE